MTESEFVEWVDEKTRAEWIDGEVLVMPPVSSGHDDLAFWFRSVVQHFVSRYDLGTVKGPEFMVRLAKLRRRRTPDVLFVEKVRAGILRPQHVEGPPDLIVEIVSPESTARDWRDKYLEYEKAGVKEYWVIDPQAGRIEAYRLTRGGTFARIAERDGKIHSAVLRGFFIRPEWVLRLPHPSDWHALKEMGVHIG